MADSESKEVSENVTENKNASPDATKEVTSDNVEGQDPNDSTKTEDQEIVHSEAENTEDVSEQKGEQGTVEQENEDITEKENVAIQSQDMPVQTESGEKSEEEKRASGKEDENPENESRTASDPSLVAPQCSKADPSTSESGNKQDRTSAKGGSNVIVKFMIMPEGQVASMSCNVEQKVGELRNHFSTELNQPPNVILLIYDDKLLEEDNLTLDELGIAPGETVNMEIQSADPTNAPLNYQTTPTKFKLPDQITVKVQSDQNKQLEVTVHVVQESRKKPFLGGYKHRLSGVEYHNASAQTIPKVRVPSPVEKFHRDTQTVTKKNKVQQTTNTTSTQMTKPGCYVSDETDKVLIPGEYLTAKQYHKNRLEKVILLQTYWRRWLAKKYVEGLREMKSKTLEWERKEELRKQKEKAERIRLEWERRLNPKNKEDFDLLYATLEKWRKDEMSRIDELYSGPQRKAALVGLLEQEAYLIASIDRHKLKADDENQDKRIKNFFDKAAAPKRWKGFDGKVTEMDTPYTIRAQELRDIYNTLSMKYLTQDERLDVLLTLKHTVKEHDCKLTQEIIELIDREADLLMRGVKESNLEGLRKRISTLFLQYCKTPLFNPEAAKLIKVPQDPAVLRKNIYFCPSCNSYLPSTEFKLSSNSRAVGRCRRCLKLDNDARLRQDLTQYGVMLKELRRVEENYGDGSRISFLLQEPDLGYLVENIWNSQSALSAHEDLFDLVLVRWNKYEEWSPWNCILLTKDEAVAHAKLQNANEAYGRMFIGKILHKHVLARNYFSRLPGMAEHMKVKIAGQTSGLHQGPKATSLRV